MEASPQSCDYRDLIRVTEWKPTTVIQRWQDLSPFFVRMLATANSEMTMLDLYELLSRGFYHCAVIDEAGYILAVVLFRAAPKPQMRVLVIEFAAGERMIDWVDAIDTYAFELKRKLGCQRLELVGRPGWTRALRKKLGERVRVKSVNLMIEEA